MLSSSHQSRSFSTASAPLKWPFNLKIRFLLAHLLFPSRIIAMCFGISPDLISFSSFLE